MKNLYLTYFTVLISTLVYSQTDLKAEEIIELKKQKKRVELTIKDLTDSINKIDHKIAQLNSEKILKKIKDSSLTTLVRKGTKLKKEPSLFSDIITTFNEDKNVIVLDYKDEHFQVCQDNICGYISEVWITPNDLISELRKSKETERNNIGYTNNNNLYSHKTILNNSKSSNTSKKQNSRTYYSGPRGGCYYINSNGNKTYVSRSLCN